MKEPSKTEWDGEVSVRPYAPGHMNDDEDDDVRTVNLLQKIKILIFIIS